MTPSNVEGPNDGGRSKKFPQVLAASAATLGAVAMGMVLGWTSPVQLKLEETYHFEVTKSDFSWIGSVVPLGASLACIPTGFLLNLIGRKRTMIAISIPFVIGWALIIWPQVVEMLIIGRFITGFCGGIFCIASPLYINEIAEINMRGLLSSFYELFICTGVLLSVMLGSFVPVFWLSVICGSMPLLFVICLNFVPETPQFYLTRGRVSEAAIALEWLRGSKIDVKIELNRMKIVVDDTKNKKGNFVQLIKEPVTRKGIVILIALMSLQELTGINAIAFYSAKLFSASGAKDPVMSAIIFHSVGVISVLPATSVVELFGRKILLLVSALGLCFCNLTLAFYFYYQTEFETLTWLPLATLISFIAFFEIGAGPVSWIVAAEIFHPQVKGPASGVGGFTKWFIAFLVTKFYAGISEALGTYTTFWSFAVCCALEFCHVLFFVPETKGKSNEDILDLLR